MLIFLSVTPGTSAARGRHVPSARCAPSPHTLLADSQGQVFDTPRDLGGVISLRACAFGQHRLFFIEECNIGEENIGPTKCIEYLHLTLTGTFIAYEYAVVSPGRYPELEQRPVNERYVVVRDLRTGRVLHKIPTGTPLTPKSPRIVGVGNVVALVLMGDGSVAWIAEDYGRSVAGPPVGPEETRLSYFDVYACDKSGTRLLASGTNVDPSSLALSVGGTRISGYPSSVPGKTVYWTQGGQTAAASLN
jgi:hypothetical protein